MKLFSNRHNLYNDQAIARYKAREIAGGIIIWAIMCLAALTLLLLMAEGGI